MKVFLHIGPHKTGTTAVQVALRRHAESKQARYYYPAAGGEDPGHAELAWRLLGLADRAMEPDVLLREVDSAEKAGFSKIVFSSEEFSRAILQDHRFSPFARLCDAFECELIITLSPLLQRVLPELQNQIRYGAAFNLLGVEDLLRLSMRRPGLRPDFLTTAILEVKATSTTVIFVDKERPDHIYDAMSTVLGEPLPVPAAPLTNRSYPYLKMFWFNAFNANVRGVKSETSRRVLDAAFAAATKELAAVAELPAPELPRPFVDYIASVWEAQLKFLEVMQDAKRLRCLRFEISPSSGTPSAES